MTDRRRITVLYVADDRYVHGLAASIWSLCENAGPRIDVDLRVVDGGLDLVDRDALVQMVGRARPGTSITFLAPPRMEGVVGGPTTTELYFARAAAGRLCPDSMHALYLDADTVVRRDVGELLGMDMAGNVALAVRDYVIATVGHPMEDLPLDEHGIDPDAAYFSSAVMWLDLDRWREADVEGAVLALGRAHRGRWRNQDQSVLNVVLHGAWGELDESWNRQVPISEEHWNVVLPGRCILHYPMDKPWDFPIGGAVGACRGYARLLRRSGWLDHACPVPTRRAPVADSPVQRLREFKFAAITWRRHVAARRDRR